MRVKVDQATINIQQWRINLSQKKLPEKKEQQEKKADQVKANNWKLIVPIITKFRFMSSIAL